MSRSLSYVRNIASRPCAVVWLCVLLLLLLSPQISALGELDGLKLRCCYLPELPYVYDDSTNVAHGKVSGLAITYLDLLEDRLGFKCDPLMLYAPENDSLKGFSGFVDAMQRCAVDGNSSNCVCDMGVGAWALSSSRYLKVDFVSPFSGDSFRVAARTSTVRDSNAKNVFFIQAFSWQVWVAIAMLGIYHIFVTLFDRNFARPTRNTVENWDELSFWQRTRHALMKTTLLYRIRRGFFNTALNFIGQTSNDNSPKTGTKQTVMNLIGLLFGVFLLTIYQSSVTVQVLVETPTSPFQSVADFKSCRIEADRVCISAGGAAERFWAEAIANSPCVKEIGKTPTIVKSFSEGFSSVEDEVCDYYYTLQGQVLTQTKGRFCGRLTAVGKSFFDTNVGFILPKGSALTSVMSEETLILREADKLESSFSFADDQKCPDVTDPTITWSKLKVFFYMAYAGLTIILLLMIFDMFVDGSGRVSTVITNGDKTPDPADTNAAMNSSLPSSPSARETQLVSRILPFPARVLMR